MDELTQIKFSEKIGISRASVIKLLKSGTLVRTATRKIDLKAPETIAYLKDRKKRIKKAADNKKKLSDLVKENKSKKKNKQKSKTIKKTKTKSKDTKKTKSDSVLKKIQKENKAAAGTGPDIFDENISNYSDSDLEDFNKDQLERIKLIEKIKIDRIKSQQMRGDLINRDLVAALFAQMYSIDINEFLQLSASLSAKICTLFGDNDPEKLVKVTEVIDKELYKTQGHIKREIDNFTEDMEKNILKDDE